MEREPREDLALEMAHAHPEPMPKQQESKMDDVPEWAKARVNELRRALVGKSLEPTFEVFARYIAAHEQPPVDPLREIADVIVTYLNPQGDEQDVEWIAATIRASLPQAALDALEKQ